MLIRVLLKTGTLRFGSGKSRACGVAMAIVGLIVGVVVAVVALLAIGVFFFLRKK